MSLLVNCQKLAFGNEMQFIRISIKVDLHCTCVGDTRHESRGGGGGYTPSKNDKNFVILLKSMHDFSSYFTRKYKSNKELLGYF